MSLIGPSPPPFFAASPAGRKRKRDKSDGGLRSKKTTRSDILAAAAKNKGVCKYDSSELGINANLHPRNIYKDNPPNFVLLAKKYGYFGEHVMPFEHGDNFFSFKKVDSLIALTRVLLEHDFGIIWNMPNKFLCPPVTQRLNYILWVEDLLKDSEMDQKTCGLDIGTGASLIFPLLGYAQCSWDFVASDIVDESIVSARENIRRNKLEEHIRVRKSAGGIFKGVIMKGDDFGFTICNPPFFSKIEEGQKNPRRSTEGIKQELICPGGEVAFVKQMIDESKAFGTQVGWFTTMLGKKKSIIPLQKHIQENFKGRCKMAETTFSQGKQSRWGLAWTCNEKTIKGYSNKLTRDLHTSQHSRRMMRGQKTEWIYARLQGEIFSLIKAAVRRYGVKFDITEENHEMIAKEEGNGFGFVIRCFTMGGCGGSKDTVVELTFRGDLVKGAAREMYNQFIDWLRKDIEENLPTSQSSVVVVKERPKIKVWGTDDVERKSTPENAGASTPENAGGSTPENEEGSTSEF